MSQKIAGIIAAGGVSNRFGQDKLELRLDEKPVIAYSTQLLSNHPQVQKVVVACSDISRTKKNIDGYVGENVEYVLGGATRAESVYNAMQLLSDFDIVLVHDGARPFATSALIDKLLKESANYTCVIPVYPINAAVKKVAKNMMIEEHVWGKFMEAQTPQLVWVEPLKHVQKIHKSDLSKYADESSIMMDNGFSVFGVRGERLNFKLTEPEDKLLAQVIANYKKK